MKKIALTKGKFALVDDENFDKLNQYKWCCSHNYAVRSISKDGKIVSLRMHRVITNAPNGYEVDHIDGNKLNNQRCNLRVCTRSQNQYNRPKYSNNTSGYKGVYWCKDRKKFQASIWLNSKDKNLGRFDSAEDAARAYNAAAKIKFGEFAYLNKV